MTPATMAADVALPRLEAETLEGMAATAFCAFVAKGECRHGDFMAGGWTAQQIARHGEAARAQGRLWWEQDRGECSHG